MNFPTGGSLRWKAFGGRPPPPPPARRLPRAPLRHPALGRRRPATEGRPRRRRGGGSSPAQGPYRGGLDSILRRRDQRRATRLPRGNEWSSSSGPTRNWAPFSSRMPHRPPPPPPPPRAMPSKRRAALSDLKRLLRRITAAPCLSGNACVTERLGAAWPNYGAARSPGHCGNASGNAWGRKRGLRGWRGKRGEEGGGGGGGKHSGASWVMGFLGASRGASLPTPENSARLPLLRRGKESL